MAARLLDAVEALPREGWAAIGRRVDTEPRPDLRTAAEEALEAVLAARGLGAVAWYVRDAIETAAHLVAADRPIVSAARPSRCRAPRRQALRAADGRDVVKARRALGNAVLAWLVQPWLAPLHFRALVDPVRWTRVEIKEP